MKDKRIYYKFATFDVIQVDDVSGIEVKNEL